MTHNPPHGHAVRWAFRLFLVPFILLAACAAPEKRGAPVPLAVREYSEALNTENIEARIHELINQERTQKGLPAMGMNSQLAGIARRHSEDMGRRNYFSHDTPEGHNFSYRFSQGGFTCEVPVGNIIYQGAENIFMQYVYYGYTVIGSATRYQWKSEEDIAREAVKGWMKSKGHRENILTPHWKTEGIGVFIRDDGEVYVTQNFC